ncbi:MAG TPA: hypothetical protein PK253_09195 [Spirochaetota bacterium]|nr:hypothetical protein [Spirochaetota bacterium]
MKHLYAAVLCLLITIPATRFAAGEGDYSDVTAVMNQLISVQKEYIRALKKAKKDDEIITAINSFGDSVISLHPKILEINKKYPGLRSANKIPGNVYELIESSKEYSKKVHDMTLLIVYRFSYNKNVKKAIDNMHTRLSSYEN